ncbi:hypothetical protein DAMA08_049770 [Martiniozyma asiatica (nom. inval.)]|nr:hypothetical protein DAMA08_049770 [Martiniozyma asiatica]
MRATFSRLLRATPVRALRPTAPRFQAPKKSAFSIPPELYPLYAACLVVCVSAVYFSWKKLATDQTLRLGRTNPTFTEKLQEAINKEE